MNKSKLQSQIKAVKKEKTKLLITLFSIVLLGIIISIISYLKTSSDLYTLIIMMVLIILLIVVLLIKPKLMYASMRHKYILLLSLAETPYKVKQNFDKNWVNNIINDGFEYSTRNDDFDVLFRVSKPVDKKIFDFSNMIEIITIFKNNNHDFYSDTIHDAYKNLWNSYNHKKHINKQVIIQIKKYDETSEEIIEKLNEVTLFSEGKNHLITINVGYFSSDSTIYFLHSNKYNPNFYYKYGVEQIKERIE